MGELFRSGGPHKIRRIGPDRHEFSITVPPDADGLIARECPMPTCAPGYFKVRLGTGLSGQSEMYCPYCRTAGPSSRFHTQEQVRYGKDQVLAEAKQGISRMFRDALGVDGSGRRNFGGGMLSMSLTYKEGPRDPVRPPREEPLRRDLVCPHCTLEQAVFGLATWCSDCGKDIFLVHVAQELQVLRTMLDAVPDRRERLGARVAGRDIEDALENTVSAFEAVLKFVTRRLLVAHGKTVQEADEVLRKEVRNAFQSVTRGAAIFKAIVGIDLFASLHPGELDFLTEAFEKRHPIAHNLGVADKAYLAKSLSAVREGREVALHASEVRRALDLTDRVIGAVYGALFSPPPVPPPATASEAGGRGS